MVAQYLNPMPTPLPREGLRSRWQQFLANPDNRAAMLSFGLQALQPVAPGQSVVGHLAQAGGAAAQTASARQDQRNESQRNQMERTLAIAELGQRGAQIENQAAQSERQFGLDTRAAEQRDRALGIDQQNADTAAVRAQVATGGKLTVEDVARFKASAVKEYAKYIQDVDMGFDVPDLHEDGTPLTAEEYINNYMSKIGITPDMITGAGGTTAVMKGDMIAAPAVPDAAVPAPPLPGAPVSPDDRMRRAFETAEGAAPKPRVSDAERITASEYLAAFGPQWTKVQQMLASPDPVQKARGQIYLQRIQQNLSDPENLR